LYFFRFVGYFISWIDNNSHVTSERATTHMRLALTAGLFAVSRVTPRIVSKPKRACAPRRAFAVNTMSDDETAIRSGVERLCTCGDGGLQFPPGMVFILPKW
jgi:hypothetical protein